MLFKNKLAEVISEKTNLSKGEIFDLLEYPKDLAMGDYAFPCFILAKNLKKNPVEVSKNLSDDLKSVWFSSENKGPYVNFKINADVFGKEVLSNISFPFNISKKLTGTIGLESPSPNSNKPLHLGHVRNMLLGLSLRNLFEKTGKKVIWFDLVNDKGTHICKSMLSYKLFGENKTPGSVNKKGDHFVGEFYVKFANVVKENPDLEKQAQNMLVAWENNDEEVVKLWGLMKSWWLEGAIKTYEDYGVKVDVKTFESDIYKEGKKLVLDGLAKGVFQKDDSGAVFADLENKGLGKKFLLRADGTSIYITQDLFLAKKRFEENKLDEFRYIVGSEQIYHFNALFEIFNLLGFDFADKCKHVSYGLIYLPEGKMKSREGMVVDADDFKKEMFSLALSELKNRYVDLSEKELFFRGEAIATAAINFFILKHDSFKDFTYFPDKSLSFQGESGPYIQYAHARICSILRKANQDFEGVDFSLLSEFAERQIITKLRDYESVILYSANNNKPSALANYLLELAQLFNSYYQNTQVMVDDSCLRTARLFLIDKVRIILKDGLALLGITALEEM